MPKESDYNPSLIGCFDKAKASPIFWFLGKNQSCTVNYVQHRLDHQEVQLNDDGKGIQLSVVAETLSGDIRDKLNEDSFLELMEISCW